MRIFPSEHDPLFMQRSLYELIEHQSGKIDLGVNMYSADEILGIPLEDLVDKIFEAIYVEPLQLHRDKAFSHEPMEIGTYRSPDGNTYAVNAMKYQLSVPFSGALGLFRHRPDNHDLQSPCALAQDGHLHIFVVGEELEEAHVKKEIEEQLTAVDKWITYQRPQLDQFSSSIRDKARMGLERRKASILKSRNIAESLGYPLLRRDGAPLTYVSPAVRKKINLKTPDRAFMPEPTLAEADYQQVLTVIEGMTRTMERSPTTFAKLDEEQLRDMYLVPLNGTFEGAATGETFNASGKTDIIVRVQDRNIFSSPNARCGVVQST
jgi:hypothetical protein